MKICWDNLKDLKFTKNGNFIKDNKTVYVEKDSCKTCGDPYLANKQNPGIFCSYSCSSTGENNYNFGKKRSKEWITQVCRKGKESNLWKGGVKKLNLPLYDTYAHQLKSIEKVRPHYDKVNLKLLEVMCVKCGSWFIPDTGKVQKRIQFINNQITHESLFYCSQECKNNCPIYRKIKYPEGFNPRKYRNKLSLYTEFELNIWSQEVLLRADYRCEICGEIAEHAHHIQPKKLEPGLALDPDNGVALCEECHNKYGHQKECSTGKLAKIICKGD